MLSLFFITALASAGSANYLRKNQILQAVQHVRSKFQHQEIDFTTQEVDTECMDALTVFRTTLDSCNASFTAVGTVFDEERDVPVSDSEVDTIINDYCDVTNCDHELLTKLESVKTSCRGQGRGGDFAWVKDVQTFITIPCIERSGTYCFPNFRKFMFDIEDETTPLTAGELASGCGDCKNAILEKWFENARQVEKVHLEWFNMICMTRTMPGDAEPTWCALHWNIMENLPEDDNSLPVLQSQCHLCTFAYIGKFQELSRRHLMTMYQNDEMMVENDQGLRWIRFMDDLLKVRCERNWDNSQFCLIELEEEGVYADNNDYFASCGAIFANPSAPVCTDDCVKTLKTFNSNVGCCSGNFFNTLNWWCRLMNASDPDIDASNPCLADRGYFAKIRRKVNSECGKKWAKKDQMPIPESCALQRWRLACEFTVNNIDEAWLAIAANRATLNSEIRASIAYQMGMHKDNVTVSEHDDHSRRLLGAGYTVSVSAESGIQSVLDSALVSLETSQPESFSIFFSDDAKGNTLEGFDIVIADAALVDQEKDESSGNLFAPSLFAFFVLLWASI